MRTATEGRAYDNQKEAGLSRSNRRVAGRLRGTRPLIRLGGNGWARFGRGEVAECGSGVDGRDGGAA